MAYAVVVTHSSTGMKVAMCSCGWEDGPQPDPRDAYRAKSRHEATHKQEEKADGD